jgi:CHAT domain-containing protein
MRAAQLALIKQPAYEHPAFWAAFNVIGDWR